jgi:hypothetical protein
MTQGNGAAAVALEPVERERLAAIAAQSTQQDVAFVEIVYGERFVRFDISRMQASFLTLDQLVDRCFREPFQLLGLPLAPNQGQLSSSTLVVKE